MGKIIIDGSNLTLEDVIKVAREDYLVEIDESAIEKVERSRKTIDKIVDDQKVVYGVTTGFGSLCNMSISKRDTKQLQENLIRSHACGFGQEFNRETVRAIMLIRINSLIKGYSGIRLETIDTLLAMLNKKVHPSIPEKGSLGASGDLAPLAHMVLPMIGLGEAEYDGIVYEGIFAMREAGIEPIQLDAKEGLALINGTTVLTAVGALVLYDAIQLEKHADIIAALTMEAQRGIIDAFDERLHVIRPHKGQVKTAENIRKLTEGSEYVTAQGELRVQDPYSLRCIPQVHGATKDSLYFLKEKVEIEINSVTDNPIVTLEGDVISGGNFHGEPMAIPFDYMGIAIAEIGNISERRLERLINGQLSDHPSFLVKHMGLNSGFMITQYAAASLVSENKVLAHPASVDSIPSSENQEDIVSMGTIAARKARDIADNVSRVLATEYMAACQALDFRDKMEMGRGTKIAYEEFRKYNRFIENDKDIEMYRELDDASLTIYSNQIVEKVEKELNIELF